jgi:hypothetical protein
MSRLLHGHRDRRQVAADRHVELGEVVPKIRCKI